MNTAIKAELRKLLSIRSTYFIAGFCTILVVFISFYAKGIKSAPLVNNPLELAETSMIAVAVVAAIMAISTVLLVTHEYRYNTITYTLTAARHRNEMLWSKVITVTIFAVTMSLFFAIVAPILNLIGWKLQSVGYIHQQLPILSVLWKVLMVGWGYSMYALIISFITRNVVASVVAPFIIPITIESLLGLWLKVNHEYLPFTALNSVMQNGVASTGKPAITVLVYITVGLVISWYLLNRRDAS